MYKVLFVDDEVLTREAIAAKTPWNEAGYTLIGTAENGKDAIEFMERERPDLLITDIYMPVMDGLELSRYVSANYPDMKIMILSGYDEFEYAKQALKCGVCEYMLKPITSAELIETLLKLKSRLDADNSSRDQIEKMRRDYEDNMPILREHFLNRIIEGKESGADLDEQMKNMKVCVTGNYQAVMLAGTSDSSVWTGMYPDISTDLMNFILYNVTGELLDNEKNILFFRNISDRCVIIISRDSEKELNEDVERISTGIQAAILKYLKINICIVVGKTVHTPLGWQASYENARYAEGFEYLFEDGGTVYGRDFSSDGGKTIQTGPWGDRIVLYIKTGQKDELEKTVKEFFRMLYEAKCERSTLNLHIQNCILAILITLEERETVSNGEFEKESSFINDLGAYTYLSDIEDRFLMFCRSVSAEIAKKRESSNQKIAVMAKDYIEKNYSNPDISLNTVCSYLNMSVSYFSMVFKTSTGETFVEALTRTRMEKARILFETTNAKTSEAAIKVGYNDPHYFGATFKRQTGMTPTEYVKKIRANWKENKIESYLRQDAEETCKMHDSSDKL